MERGLFKLTNYQDHPTHKYYKVFTFKNIEQGNYFESLLIESKIDYERFLDEEEEEPRLFFGVRNPDFEAALKLNYMANARYRRPFITSTLLKYALLIFTFGVLALALIGYLSR